MMRIWKGLQCVAISHWSNGFSVNEEYLNISLKADLSLTLSLIDREKSNREHNDGKKQKCASQ